MLDNFSRYLIIGLFNDGSISTHTTEYYPQACSDGAYSIEYNKELILETISNSSGLGRSNLFEVFLIQSVDDSYPTCTFQPGCPKIVANWKNLMDDEDDG